MNPMDMLKNLKEAEATLNNFKAQGESGAGMVKITINGQYEVIAVEISKEVIDPENPKLLEDLIIASFRQASAQVKIKLSQELMSMGALDLNLNNNA